MCVGCNQKNGAEYIIEQAVSGNNTEIRSYLESNGLPDLTDERGNTLLMIAILEGHEELIQLLIDAGADVNYQSEESRHTPVVIAAFTNDYRVLELLLNHGVSTQVEGHYVALSHAAAKDDATTVKMLLDYGFSEKLPDIFYPETVKATAIKNDSQSGSGSV